MKTIMIADKTFVQRDVIGYWLFTIFCVCARIGDSFGVPKMPKALFIQWNFV